MKLKFHKELTPAKWQRLKFVEQMANVGSDVIRALNWRKKGKSQLSENAFERALELLYLTISCSDKLSTLTELARIREALLDFFYGDNEYETSDKIWSKYFNAFNYAARNRQS